MGAVLSPEFALVELVLVGRHGEESLEEEVHHYNGFELQVGIVFLLKTLSDDLNCDLTKVKPLRVYKLQFYSFCAPVLGVVRLGELVHSFLNAVRSEEVGDYLQDFVALHSKCSLAFLQKPKHTWSELRMVQQIGEQRH